MITYQKKAQNISALATCNVAGWNIGLEEIPRLDMISVWKTVQFNRECVEKQA